MGKHNSSSERTPRDTEDIPRVRSLIVQQLKNQGSTRNVASRLYNALLPIEREARFALIDEKLLPEDISERYIVLASQLLSEHVQAVTAPQRASYVSRHGSPAPEAITG